MCLIETEGVSYKCVRTRTGLCLFVGLLFDFFIFFLMMVLADNLKVKKYKTKKQPFFILDTKAFW